MQHIELFFFDTCNAHGKTDDGVRNMTRLGRSCHESVRPSTWLGSLDLFNSPDLKQAPFKFLLAQVLYMYHLATHQKNVSFGVDHVPFIKKERSENRFQGTSLTF